MKAIGLGRQVIGPLIAVGMLAGCAAHQTSPDEAGAPKIGKSDELLAAKTGPTASQVFGNPKKWAGTYVKLDCEITNVVADSDTPMANARCGKGVSAQIPTTQPNVDYSDPDAVNKALAEQAKASAQFGRDIQDQAFLVLVGDHVSDFDGNQRVTVIGPVLGSMEGKNAMGVTMDYATVRVDYAQ